jgi:hypothetical protein
MMTINLMDGKLYDEEKKLTLSFANDFDFRNSEITQMAKKADDLVIVIKWYVENYNK